MHIQNPCRGSSEPKGVHILECNQVCLLEQLLSPRILWVSPLNRPPHVEYWFVLNPMYHVQQSRCLQMLGFDILSKKSYEAILRNVLYPQWDLRKFSFQLSGFQSLCWPDRFPGAQERVESSLPHFCLLVMGSLLLIR